MEVETLEDSYQLSPIQQGMLFHSLYIQHSGVDIEQMVCTIHESLQAEAFQQAWQRVVDQHPILRTSFRWEADKEPLQEVHRQVQVPFEQQDWRKLSAKEQSSRLLTYLQVDRQQGFVLAEAPLMRLALFQISESNYHFIWTFHHALLDGRSLPIVLKEVFAFYDAFCQGKDLQLQQPSLYRDHIKWLGQQDLSKAEEFFRQLLRGFTAPTPLVVQKAGKNQEESSFALAEIRLPVAITSQLQSLAQQYQLTLNTLVQGAWGLLLWRYSGERDIVFGATRACRRSSVAGAESMVGVLINTLPVRVRMSPRMPLLPWLKELRAAWIDLRKYEHTPLVKIQEWSDIPSGKSLFESILVFENYSLNSKLRSFGGRWENLQFRLLEQTNYPLTLVGYLDPELLLELKYDRQRFDDATITRMLGHLKTLLESMAANPWQCLDELPLLTADERLKIVVEWNNTQADFPKKMCIHQMFEAQVERSPNSVAVVFENEQLSYRELNCRANQLAHHLQQLGVRPGVLVAIYLDRSLEMIPALLGILKAGGAYVPIDTTVPRARLQWLLSSLNINCLVTQSSQLERLQNLQQQLPELKHLICLDTSQPTQSIDKEVIEDLSGRCQLWKRSALDQLSSENLSRLACSEDIAYVIFTSGSTGTPKGVVIRHKSVINLIDWVNSTFNINSSDRVLFITSLTFDLSVYDVFGLLAAGGSIRVASNHDVREPATLLRILCNEQITFWNSAPAALQQLVCFFPSLNINKNKLRLVFLSGDWIPVNLPNLVKTTFPGVEVISLGGATEATVWSNYYPIGDVAPHWVSIPYGKPIQNAQYYILDSYLNPCPVGVPGELYIGGEVLCSGYFNQPALTAEKFIPNSFSNNLGAQLYKSGDLARYLPEGNIEFLGRIDHQVKIRGFRIELSEVESALSQHPSVRETVVITQEIIAGNSSKSKHRSPDRTFPDKQLVAYVVTDREQALTTSELRKFLTQLLPSYMVPSIFVILDALPLTPNGKVDRGSLKAPDQERPALESAFVAPRSTLELQLTKIWSEVLEIQPIGIKDNFFDDLGGHSLKAVRLVQQIKKKFGIDLPLATLFQAATVEQLAKILRDEERLVPWSSLVTIQPSGYKIPLFCVHSIGGNVLCYRDLSRHLGLEQPVYGLQAQGLDGIQPPHFRVEDMATHYIQEIRTIQPNGPYLLAGYSSGGTVAFEMAQQLDAQGHKVDLLALFDAPSPIFKPNNSISLGLWLSIYWRNLSQLKPNEKWAYILERMKFSNFFDFDRAHPGNQYHLPKQLYSNLLKVHHQAFKNYVPRVYPGRVTLLRTRDQYPKFSHDPQLGWGALVSGGLQIYEIRGPHEIIMTEPYVRILADKLRVCLDEVQTTLNSTEIQSLSSFLANQL